MLFVGKQPIAWPPYVSFGGDSSPLPVVSPISLRLLIVQMIAGIAIGFACTSLMLVAYAGRNPGVVESYVDQMMLSPATVDVDSSGDESWPPQADAATSTTSTTEQAIIADSPEFVDPESHVLENSDQADRLFGAVRVTCLVMSTPQQYLNRAPHVRRSWAHRCNRLLFASAGRRSGPRDPDELHVAGEPYGWPKLRNALRLARQHYGNVTDFYLRADDRSYAVLENVRHMLWPYAPDARLYFGSDDVAERNTRAEQSATGNFVLSRGAVDAVLDSERCERLPMQTGVRDGLRLCLRATGVRRGRSRDERGTERFAYLSSELGELLPERPANDGDSESDSDWYRRQLFRQPTVAANATDQQDCCSARLASLHPLTPPEMYAIDVLLYTVKPFGIVDAAEPLPERLTEAELLELPKVSAANW